MLVTGEQTDGRYCLIDMHIPVTAPALPSLKAGVFSNW